MSITNKQTIYVDIDDEITAIIDKVKTSPEKIVALVLPKRATVLQSIVNMKLLKKAAAGSKKSLVLITSEMGLLPLAGVVGIHVAKSLQSKPVIPLLPDRDENDLNEISEVEIDDEPVTAPVAAVAASESDDDMDTIELDDAEEPAAVVPDTKMKRLKKGFKVPNFDRFRLSFFLAILAVILLIVGWIMAAIVLPKAVVSITTDTSTTVSNTAFTANTALKDLNVAQGLVPAVQKEVKKTDTEKTTATGKKDVGTKASGSVTVRNCDYSDGFTIPSGSTFTASGKQFISAADVTVPKFTGPSSGCSLSGSSSGKATVAVTAAASGESYNLAAQGYSVPGVSSSAKVDSIGTDMTGGTSKVVAVVSQDDVTAAAAKMKGRLDNAAKSELGTQLRTENLKSLDETLIIGAPAITATPAVGTEASGEVVVTSVTNYSILGVKADYLSQIIKKDASAKIDLVKQSILDDGLGNAVLRLTASKSPTEVQMSMQTLVVAGPQLNANAIKEEIKGKKRGDVQRIITSKPGVKDVTITYSPFWVLSTPKSVKKITISIQKPVITKTTATNSANP